MVRQSDYEKKVIELDLRDQTRANRLREAEQAHDSALKELHERFSESLDSLKASHGDEVE